MIKIWFRGGGKKYLYGECGLESEDGSSLDISEEFVGRDTTQSHNFLLRIAKVAKAFEQANKTYQEGESE